MAGSMEPIIYYLWRAMTRLLCLLALVAALALPASALAQGNAFGPLPPADTPVPTVAPSDNSNTQQDEGTGTSTLLLIGGGLVLLFVVIATVIVRDARTHVPEERLRHRLREEGPHKRKRQSKAKARAKGRASRAARKRTIRNR
jgi:hypothetical protein